MFFFIGGIQPKTIDLDKQPRLCPSCGLHQATLKRVDHYLSIFFIPILRVKKGNSFVQCQRCGALFHETGERWLGTQEMPYNNLCPHCRKPVEQDFHFCPYCGKPVR